MDHKTRKEATELEIEKTAGLNEQAMDQVAGGLEPWRPTEGVENAGKPKETNPRLGPLGREIKPFGLL